ncbi:MAG TPA: glutamate-1-semialdehyde 2,1-aminomutase [Candidatus Merdenecus merdavium]|nr:glutamate-1-semialdehyde 2,1-aminomutase [Candidatus Merdenecus merdavium]
MTNSENLFKEAIKVIPGGVNSPVRAFPSVGGAPRFIKKAYGSHIIDEDNKEYIDYIGSWGPMLLGHNHHEIQAAVVEAAQSGLSFGAATKLEVTMAKSICEAVPAVEMVRMVNSGTEAVMSAIRVARGFTKREKIIKFTGCYHGHSDAMLVAAGSGALTGGVPDSAGVPKGTAQDTLIAHYNDIDSVKILFEKYQEEIAAVIIEPVAANMGVVITEDGFLQELRNLCHTYGALLIFDEVITGFRLGLGGASEYYHIKPDLITFGKIIGAGMPVGAFGGRREIMEQIAPLGPVYQAGTLSGNPVAMAAGIAQLKILTEDPTIYQRLNERGQWFYQQIEEMIQQKNLPLTINHIGSLGSMFFTPNKVRDLTTAKMSDTKAYASYFHYMLDHGIYLAPAQFEAMFLSSAHTREDLELTLEILSGYFEKLPL